MLAKLGEQVVVVAFSGECLDASTVGELRERIAEALSRGVPVVLDVGGVGFADTSGLGLVRTMAARRFAIVGVGPGLSASLSRIPPDRRPPEYETVEAAARALARPSSSTHRTLSFDVPMTAASSIPPDPTLA